MDTEQIRDFLHRIATEPVYRKELEDDPVGTLAKLGVKVKESDIPAGGITLPTNQEILEKLDAFAIVLTPHLCLRIFRIFRH